MLKLEPSPIRYGCQHCTLAVARHCPYWGYLVQFTIFRKYLNAHLKFMVYGRKQASTYVTNTLPQCNPASVGLAQAWMYTNDNLVSRPLVCVHNNTRLAKSGEGLWAFITWMTSGGREVDGGGGAKLPKQYTGSSVQVLYCSFGLQMLAWSKLLILTGKKLAFKFSAYIFEYWPLPPLRTPRIHSCDECSQAFPFFASLSLPCIIVNANER